jgi:cytochrome c-type biogenesis protein CcmH
LMIALVIAGIGAFGTYALVGKPSLKGHPRDARLVELEEKARTNTEAMTREEMLTLLAARAERTPDDFTPHFYIGQLLADGGRDSDAAQAFQAALRRAPNNPMVMTELGRALVRLDGRSVGPEALQLFKAAAAQKPEDPIPAFYIALAASQAGEGKAAVPLWRRLLTLLPPDDPRREMANQMLSAALTGSKGPAAP